MMHYETQLIRLLLVESDEQSCRLFRQYLDQASLNFVITEASSGGQAIALSKSQLFDCILSANELCDMNGQTMLSFIQDGPTLSVPVIVYADSDSPGLALELLESGAMDFMPKQLCTGLMLRRCILHALVRQQYIRSQQEYLSSHKFKGQQSWYEEERKIEMLKSEKAHAEAANRAKSKFLSNMSHELRTPLNAILGFAQLLKFRSKNPLTDHQSDNVEEIIKAGNHLLSLINDVLDLSKIEAGHIDIKLEVFNILPLIEESVKLTKALANTRQCQVTTAIEFCPQIKADKIRLKQVLLNLLSNAIKYNRTGGSVHIKTHPQGDNFMRIEVIDTGFGISDELFDQVFQPFSRLTAMNSAIEGSGIGLTLSQKLMYEMAGDIGFSSEVNIGSCFWLDVPLVKSDHYLAATQGDSKCLLYVNGCMDQLLAFKALWQQKTALELIACDHLDIAIKLTRRKNPQWVIVDLDQLLLSPQEIVASLRRSPSTEGAKLIALTEKASTQRINQGLSAGFNAVQMTPLSLEKLVEDALQMLI